MKKSITPSISAALFFLLMLVTNFQTNIAATTNQQNTDNTNKPIEKVVVASPTNVNPLLIGASIPSITLKTIENKDINLLDLVKDKPTIFIFYRGGWCPYCNLHLGQLRLIEPQLIELGYQLVAVSPDRVEKLQETYEKNKLNYLLLSDSLANAAINFGIAFQLDSQTIESYKKYGVDLEKYAGEKHHILPVPSVFIVDTTGKIKFQYVNPDYKTRLSSDVILAAAKSVIATK